MTPWLDDGDVKLVHGDCRTVMRELAADSIDSIVCDPPYGLEFMGKDWDRFAPQNTTARVQRGNAGGFGEQKWRSGTRGVRTTFRCGACGGWSGTFSEARRARQRPCECETPDYDYAGAPAPMLAFQAWCEEWAREALRIAKPGAHLLAFGGTRTSHRLASALEDAGWEIRDTLTWLYGSGFPKSHAVDKAIDRLKGVQGVPSDYQPNGKNDVYGNDMGGGTTTSAYQPATPDAARWEGWGTALKPAHEPIILARKPLGGTVARNVLEHGTGALNIDATRIGTDVVATHHTIRPSGDAVVGRGAVANGATSEHTGRWPANVVLTHHPDCQEVGTRTVKSESPPERRIGHGSGNPASGVPFVGGKITSGYADESGHETIAAWRCVESCPVRILDEQSGELASGTRAAGDYGRLGGDGRYNAWDADPMPAIDGSRGGASRFFYTAKASRSERNDGLHDHRPIETHRYGAGVGNEGDGPTGGVLDRNHHPTVKPVQLMRWLTRLVTPPGGLVLDPFIGSGSTAVAARAEGFRCIGIDQDETYLRIAAGRLSQQSLLGGYA